VSEATLLFLFSFLAFLFSISVHESAHALVADRCGDPTARLLGRISLNPLRHMELFGTVVLPILMFLSGLPTFGWAKPTPVVPSKLRNPRRDDMLVSFAGPASNLLVALLCVAALLAIRAASAEGARVVEQLSYVGVAGMEGSPLIPAAMLLYRLLWISVILGIFNLLPVPPLDGSHILSQLLPPRAQSWYLSVSRFGFILLLVALWYTPLDTWIFDRPMRVFNSILRM
jgi:Zn-dependent protease